MNSEQGQFLLNADERGKKSPLDGEALHAYWRVIVKWRWVVLGALASCVFIAVVYTLFSTPIYRGTATLEIARSNTKVVNIEGVEPNSFALDQEFYQTQYGLLQSFSLAERVVRSLGLAHNGSFMNGYSVPTDGSLGARQRDKEGRIAFAAAKISDNLEIEPIRASSLVRVHYRDSSKALAARIANAIGESFIQANLDRRYQASSYARQFLESRLEQTRQRLENSERALVNYAGNNGIITLSSRNTGPGTTSATGTADQSIVAANLSSLNDELAKATADRFTAESQLTSAGTSAMSRTDVLNNPAIAEIMKQRAVISGEYAKGLNTFKPDYPAMISMRQQIAELDRQISMSAGRFIKAAQRNYDSAARRENLLKSQVDSLKSQLLGVRSRSIQYAVYQRDVDTNRALYDGLLQRYKEVGIAGGVGTNNVSIVDSAEVPSSPYRPRPLFNLAIAIVAGLLIGFGVSFSLEQIDGSIVAPHDFESKLDIPLLGSVPLSEADDVLADLTDQKSPVSEAYYSLQTSLQFTTNAGSPKTLFVTSSRASEGKSTTALAIARNFARLGSETILVDADLRKPSVHRSLALPNTSGLSNLLSLTDDPLKVLQSTKFERLRVVTSGPLPPSPAELLYGDRFAELLERLGGIATHIVIDGPPVLGLADAPLLASAAAGTVFVIEAGSTPSNLAMQAIRRLKDAHARIVGGVLTKFNARKAGYGYDYGASYRYGEDTNTPT